MAATLKHEDEVGVTNPKETSQDEGGSSVWRGSTHCKPVVVKYPAAQTKTIEIRVMVVGESGLGKTTLLKTMVALQKQVERRDHNEPLMTLEDLQASFKEFGLPELVGTIHHGGIEKQTKAITPIPPLLFQPSRSAPDGSTYLYKVQFIDTPGFGESTDWNKDYEKIETELHRRLNEHVDSKVQEGRELKDECVHLCLYLIHPHRLKEADAEFIKKLSKLVTVLLVVAKADTMTDDERKEFTPIVHEKLSQVEGSSVQTFDLDSMTNTERPRILYFVSGWNQPKAGHNEPDFQRPYAWGVCRVLDENHSDLLRFFNAITACGMQIQDSIQPITKKLTSAYSDRVKAQAEAAMLRRFALAALFVLLTIVAVVVATRSPLNVFPMFALKGGNLTGLETGPTTSGAGHGADFASS